MDRPRAALDYGARQLLDECERSLRAFEFYLARPEQFAEWAARRAKPGDSSPDESRLWNLTSAIALGKAMLDLATRAAPAQPHAPCGGVAAE